MTAKAKRNVAWAETKVKSAPYEWSQWEFALNKNQCLNADKLTAWMLLLETTPSNIFGTRLVLRICSFQNNISEVPHHHIFPSLLIIQWKNTHLSCHIQLINFVIYDAFTSHGTCSDFLQHVKQFSPRVAVSNREECRVWELAMLHMKAAHRLMKNRHNSELNL